MVAKIRNEVSAWRVADYAGASETSRALLNWWFETGTRKNRDLEFISAPHTYTQAGRYTVAVKVIDIFGNDTMVLVPVSVG